MIGGLLLPKGKKSTEKGAHAEKLAEKLLKQNGLRLIQRNYRCKCGEIDLIMQDSDIIAFIEVRLRTNRSYASGAETVTLSKQRKIINAASHYLQRNSKLMENPARFDVVSVSCSGNKPGNTPGEHADFDWVKNAFEVNY